MWHHRRSSTMLPYKRRTLPLLGLSVFILAEFASTVSIKTTTRRKAPPPPLRCDYTLVVQEFHPSLCPSVVGHHLATRGGSSSAGARPAGTNATVARSTDDKSNALPVYIQDGETTDEYAKRSSILSSSSSSESSLTSALIKDMVRKLEEAENKLDSAISTNALLRASNDLQAARIDRVESQVRDMEKSLGVREAELETRIRSLEENLTGISSVLATDERSRHWKGVELKLTALMLDMTELGQALAKHDRKLERLGTPEKVIEVQAMTQVVLCSPAPNSTKYRDCEEYFLNGHTKSGIYFLNPLYSPCPIPVYCDMDTPPGGWTVIQRRQDGSVSFNRSWAEYRAGFGAVGGEFWLGLDNIFLLTSQKRYELRVDLWDFFGTRVHAAYGAFHVEGEREGYRLSVANHSGSVADGMQHHDSIQFSTPDRDQDTYPNYHCAKEWGAGWWFANCWFVILNGQYFNQSQVEYRGIAWNEWKSEQLQKSEMKIRPSTLHSV